MEKISRQEYASAVIACIRLARQSTSGGRVAAQVLLSAYNGAAFQLDVADMGSLDRSNYEMVMTVIRGRYDTGHEPHNLVKDGSTIFQNLWNQWEHLHVEERGKPACPECDGRGKLYLNMDDDNDMRTRPCPRCDGKGRVCRCAR